MATTSPRSTFGSPAPSAPGPSVDGNSTAEQDWPAKATDKIVTQIGAIRDKTTGPARNAARYAVYAAFAVSLGTVALIIFVIGAVRALDNYLPEQWFGESHTWLAHTIIGATFLLVGMAIRVAKIKGAES